MFIYMGKKKREYKWKNNCFFDFSQKKKKFYIELLFFFFIFPLKIEKKSF